MKYVHYINGHRVRRPGKDHPNDAHWQQLRREVIADQKGMCGVCWEEGGDVHHRHYDNWGEEKREDVILLCRPCHEAITVRIRLLRAAHGDQSIKLERNQEVQTKQESFRAAEKVVGDFIRPPPKKRDGNGFRPKSRQELAVTTQAKAT